MEIVFPLEFIVNGAPVSFQSKRAASREQWKTRIKDAGKSALPAPHYVSEGRIAVTLFYFPAVAMAGDIDNIVKPILDALTNYIYLDDHQVERIVVQKFDPGNIFEFRSPSEIFTRALVGDRPSLYIRIGDDPFEELS